MVTDSLQILCDHQQIQTILAVFPVSRDHVDQCFLGAVEGIVHNIVHGKYLFHQNHVLIHIGIHSGANHLLGSFCHQANILAFLSCTSMQKGDDLPDILGLVADALHVGDDFHSCADLPQIPGNGLLLKEHLQADCLNIPFHLIDFLVVGCGFVRNLQTALQQCFHSQINGRFTGRSHFNELSMQSVKLVIKQITHYPNLPVM